MIPKPFEQISKEDIDRLIADETPKNRTVEYSNPLPMKRNSTSQVFAAVTEICKYREIIFCKIRYW